MLKISSCCNNPMEKKNTQPQWPQPQAFIFMLLGLHAHCSLTIISWAWLGVSPGKDEGHCPLLAAWEASSLNATHIGMQVLPPPWGSVWHRCHCVPCSMAILGQDVFPFAT